MSDTEAPVKPKSRRGGARPNTGGARPNSGRPRLKGTVEDCIDELVFPCVVKAWQNERTKVSPFDGQWVVHISKTNIRRVYGEEGVQLFNAYFVEKRRGGYSRQTGKSFETRWEVRWAQYKMVKLLLERMGHDIKDIMSLVVKFPPDRFVERVRQADERSRLAREAKQAARVPIAHKETGSADRLS